MISSELAASNGDVLSLGREFGLRWHAYALARAQSFLCEGKMAGGEVSEAGEDGAA